MGWWIVSVVVVFAYACAMVHEAKHAPTVDDSKEVQKRKNANEKSNCVCRCAE